MKPHVPKLQIVFSLSLVLILVVVGMVSASTPTPIDPYSVSQTLTTTWPDTPTAASFVADSSALGGERDIVLTITSGDIGQEAEVTVNHVGDNLLTVYSGTNTLFKAEIQWDGVDTSANLDPIGLRHGSASGINLLSDPTHDRFLVGVAGSDVGGRLTIRAYTDATHCSEKTIMVGAIIKRSDHVVYSITYASMTRPSACTGGPVDMTNVGALVLTLKNDAESASWDVQLYPLTISSHESQPSSLHLIALGFDNPVTSTTNLDPYFTETMQFIANATRNAPEKVALVLADRGGGNPDAIYEISNGIVTEISSQWPAMPQEIAFTDSTQLGAFLQWARNRYPGINQTTLTIAAHNLFVAPDTEVFAGLADQTSQMSSASSELFPLPLHIGVETGYTDESTHNVLSVYDLTETLRLATQDGSYPIQVLNLSSCFGLSIENLYPLQDYVETVVGGPNYVYFSPQSPSLALQVANPAHAAEVVAANIVAAYQNLVPSSDHPYILTAMRTAYLGNVKEAWDALSYELMQGLNDPTQSAVYKTTLLQAYQSSGKYDTTYCPPQDWDCAAPDALVDMGEFTAQLRDRFGSLWPNGIATSNAADDALNYLQASVITRSVQNGTPWFAAPLTPSWNFAANMGISLYADLQGKPRPNAGIELSGVAHWYSNTQTADNPHPYAFISNGTYGPTWANVFYRYWEGTNITTSLCLPNFPPIEQTGDVSVESFASPLPGWAKMGLPVAIAPILTTTHPIRNLVITVSVTQGGSGVFTDTIVTGYLTPGQNKIDTFRSWIPTSEGPATISVTADATNIITETNETNNTQTLSILVRKPAYNRPSTITVAPVNGQQWFYGNSISLNIAQIGPSLPVNGERVNELRVDFWQYQTGADPNHQVPVFLGYQRISTNLAQIVTATLPSTVHPGIVVMNIWPRSMLGGLGYPTSTEISYLPSNTGINHNQENFYRFGASAGDTLNLTCTVSQGSAVVYVWSPGNPWSALTAACAGTLSVPTLQNGSYLVSVLGTADNTLYTLNGTRNAAQLDPRAGSLTPEFVARSAPEFAEPIPQQPEERKVYIPVSIR